MDENIKLTSKQICSTCLSTNRKLSQLIKINDGVNFFYTLLSHDAAAYREAFLKDIAQFYVCWECRAIIERQIHFKEQVCSAQKKLALFSHSCISFKSLGKCLSRLSICNKTPISYTENLKYDTENHGEYSEIYIHNVTIPENSVEVEYQFELLCNKDTIDNKDIKLEELDSDTLCSETIDNTKEEKLEFYTIIEATREEIKRRMDDKRSDTDYRNSVYVCDCCVQRFRDNQSLVRHVKNTHSERKNYILCDICQNFIEKSQFEEHKADHTQYYRCNICGEIMFLKKFVLQHLLVIHRKKPADVCVTETPVVKNPGSKPRINPALRDEPTTHGFACPECDLYFENKKLRYKHIQRQHREGFKCTTCGKTFSFKNNLKKHELIHSGLVQREQCPQCGKVIRADCMGAHTSTHARRTRVLACVACDKRFVSRATYEHHLKYTKAHATHDILKFKCAHCDRGYRSKAELRDHINYFHMGKTQHKCPICGKAIASKRCIKRHIARNHSPKNKDNAKDEICQVCGKAFRLKKSLREHELIHSGERPLSCEICGNTFRQRASLYTHKKLVHKVFPKKINVVFDE